MIRYLSVVAICALMAACQPAFINGKPNENSPYFEVPAGSTFVLRRQAAVPAHAKRLYFQDGRSPAWQAVDKYRAYCVLQVEGVQERDQTIEPDEFVVTKVSTQSFFQLIRAPKTTPPLRMAAAGDAVRMADSVESSDRDSYQVVGWVMGLGSARQPQVQLIACAAWGLPQSGTYITVQKIRQALGESFDLNIAPL